MIQLENTKVYVGSRDDSRIRSNPSWAVVNTAKTVHIEVKGWSNAPPRDHPDYLAFEEGQFLSFNWVDGAARMYDWSGPEAFVRALDFIDKWYESKTILINCDLGQSRSPTVALLYLSKRLHLIPDDSFVNARAAFQGLYPGYAPAGIADYVATHWAEIN
ncbi:hypothetical protein [Sneathiella sp.]|uniref:hypothetical protein n=1 Tax=Sneathiella sp. TaxID=1964365 RepID=UPI00356B1F8E